MSGISAFIQGFAGTTLELQKRKQEQMQFQAQLAMQQNQMQMQQQQFQQQLQFRESQRQDELAQNKTRNEIDRFNALGEAANKQSLMATRKKNLAIQERMQGIKASMQGSIAQMSGPVLELENEIAHRKAAGVDTTEQEKILAERKAPLDKIMADLSNVDAALEMAREGDQPQQGQQQGQQNAQAQGQQPPGSTQAGPLTGEAQPQPAQPQGQPQPQPDGFAPQGPEQPQQMQPPQQQPAQVMNQQQQPSQPQDPSMRYSRYIVRDAAEAELKNAENKKYGIPAYYTTLQQLDEETRKKVEDQYKIDLAEARRAATPDQVERVRDAFRNAGVDVDVEAIGKGSKTHSRRLGGHFGGTVLNSGLSFGGTEGMSEESFPVIDFFPKAAESGRFGGYAQLGQNIMKGVGLGGTPAVEGMGENRDPGVALKIAEALATQDRNTPISQPYINAAQNVIRDRAAEMGKYAKTDKPIEAQPFDGVNNPERHRAASTAVTLTKAEQVLQGIAKTDFKTVGLPQVVDAKTDPVATLDLFEKAVGRLETVLPSMNPKKGEGQTIQELMTRLKPDAEGQFSPDAARAARDALRTVQKASVSDQFKMQAEKVLGPIAEQAVQPEGNIKTGFKTSQRGNQRYLVPDKEQAQAEGGSGGIPGVRGAATMAALGGLSQFGASKAQKEQGQKPKPAPAPSQKPQAQKPTTTAAQTINGALGSIGASKNREEAAKAALTTITSNFSSLSETEKKAVRTSWNSAKAKWKSLGVSDAAIAKVERLINPK
jgi:hypothetical protein